MLLQVKNIDVAYDEFQVIWNVSISIDQGEMVALLGPNGSGKSTLAKVLAGHPSYQVTGGEVLYLGQSILEMEPDERALAGIFMAFQYPVEIPGVSIANFLRTALQARLGRGEELDLFDFQDQLLESMKLLEVEPSFAERPVNDGFSGGEKKRNEILQMAVLQPTLAIMDETDSGLDIDALQIVSKGVNTLQQQNPEMTILMITHYQRLLDYIKPDLVHVMVDGKIVRTGGPELALELERQGYADWKIPS